METMKDWAERREIAEDYYHMHNKILGYFDFSFSWAFFGVELLKIRAIHGFMSFS